MKKAPESTEGKIQVPFTEQELAGMKTQLAELESERIAAKQERSEFLSDSNKTIKDLTKTIGELTANIKNRFRWEDPNLFESGKPVVPANISGRDI